MPQPLTNRPLPLEALIWALALAVLAVLPPGSSGHFTFCIPSHLGMDWCWGCGVGEAIGHTLRGDLEAGFTTHPAGPLAVVVLVGRIVTLIFKPTHKL